MACPRPASRRGIPYFDLADARDFVTGIGALDAAARDAGVTVIAGASTAPALTGAVARQLAEGLDRVDQVEIALSASARTTSGASVARAILSYVGRPVRLWRGGRWGEGRGWQELRRAEMRAGAAALRRRVALADVPDHDLLPAMLPGRPAVAFRAGNDLGHQMWFLWLASWPVRWGWLRSLGGAGPLRPLQRATAWLGGDSSGMTVALTGRQGAEAVERRWSVVAVDGTGRKSRPWPPCCWPRICSRGGCSRGPIRLGCWRWSGSRALSGPRARAALRGKVAPACPLRSDHGGGIRGPPADGPRAPRSARRCRRGGGGDGSSAAATSSPG